jgi:2-C-methyl-D-erythritol 4-phosphate cytidylyltransferase
MRQMATDGSSKVIGREDLRIVQTPQTFHASMIKEAFALDYRDEFTDEASVLEYTGKTVTLVEGEESNLKITFKEDLDYASWKLQNQGP